MICGVANRGERGLRGGLAKREERGESNSC